MPYFRANAALAAELSRMAFPPGAGLNRLIPREARLMSNL